MSNNVTISFEGAKVTSGSGPEDGYVYYHIESNEGQGIGKLTVYNFNESTLSPQPGDSGYPTTTVSGTTLGT